MENTFQRQTTLQIHNRKVTVLSWQLKFSSKLKSLKSVEIVQTDFLNYSSDQSHNFFQTKDSDNQVFAEIILTNARERGITASEWCRLSVLVGTNRALSFAGRTNSICGAFSHQMEALTKVIDSGADGRGRREFCNFKNFIFPWSRFFLFYEKMNPFSFYHSEESQLML
jgi:hypothetical protein